MERKLFKDENAADLKVVIGLNRAANFLNKKANVIFRKHGLTQMQFAVLEVLYHKGDLKIGQIIEKVLTTGGNMTVVINNLEKDGMILKYCHPSDSRACVVSITSKGAAKMEEIFPEYLKDLQDNVFVLSNDEKQELIDLLHKLSV